jgi:hypothetical protein
MTDAAKPWWAYDAGTHDPACHGKIAYRSRADAKTAVERTKFAKRRARAGVYQCNSCHQWHVGNTSISGANQRKE